MIGAWLLAMGLNGRGALHRYEIDAPELGDPHRAVRVYTPPGYDDQGAAERRYPVVYLLHGWPGSDGNWPGLGRAVVTADSLIASGRIPPVILVFPNGNGRGWFGRSLYLDSYDGTSRMHEFVARHLVGWVDSVFRTLPTPPNRAVAGLSDGGTAAINLALRHPDVFGACSSQSGALHLEKPVGLGAVLGPEPGATRLLEANSPLDYAAEVLPRARGPVIYFDCGADDENVADNRAFDRLLTSLGVPHTYVEYGGGHGWSYWRSHLAQSLIAVTAGMSDASLAERPAAPFESQATH